MKIDNIYNYISKKGVNRDITEMNQGQKSCWNSHSGNMVFTNLGNGKSCKGYLTWGMLKKKFFFRLKENKDYTQERYLILRDKIVNLNDGNEKLSLAEACQNIFKDTEKYEEFENFINLNKFPKILLKLCQGKDVCDFHTNENNAASLTVNKYPQKKVTFNCTFIFPMEDDDLMILLKNKQVATYLDEGVAFVSNVFEYCNTNSLLDDGFITLNSIPK